MKKYFKFISAITCLSIIFLTFFGCFGGTSDEKTTGTTSPGIETVRVTFPEGFTTAKIAERLEENGVCKAEDFINAVNAYEGELLPENPQSRPYLLEGYVFPDTYDFYVGESADSVLKRFLSNFSNRITESDKSRAQELGYTVDEILIIASIIQKEASIQSEMADVSSVLHNRLNSSTRLECNVTFEYVTDTLVPFLASEEVPDGGSADAEKIKEQYYDLYNTYRFKGLPAGPLCNPGYEAITAALRPNDTDYLFFFTDKDNLYHYAKTYSEHCDLIDEYGLLK